MLKIALGATIALCLASPAFAQGEVLITQAKALAGGITLGDEPGFPIRLNQHGSYKFATNILVPRDKIGFWITSDLTLDLNGFSLFTQNGATTGISGQATGVTIKNGTINGFLRDGINGFGPNWIIDNIKSFRNFRNGITADDFAIVRNSQIFENYANGIRCAENCHIEGNLIDKNHSAGLTVITSTVIGNTIRRNLGAGIISSGNTAYGNNAILDNNMHGGPQIDGIFIAMQPNACVPACP